MKVSVWLLATVLAGLAAQSSRPATVKTCAEVTRAQPGLGASYRGLVRNDDYRLTATVPEGSVAWGADPTAPFHGFTIFLTDDRSSCIVLEIYLRINGASESVRHRGTKVMLGHAIGWKRETAGVIAGTNYTNVVVQFSDARDERVDDGTVMLVAPTKDIGRMRPTFEAFLAHLRFDDQ